MLQLVNVTSAPSLMFTPPPYQQRKSVNTVMDKVGGGGLPSWTHILRTATSEHVGAFGYPLGRWTDSAGSHIFSSVLVHVAAVERDFASVDVNASTLPAEKEAA